MNKLFLSLLYLLMCESAWAQFAPQAALSGSTAVHKDSSIFVSWGTKCIIEKGWLDIANQSWGYVNFGDSTKALGKADGDLVSLGDGGRATYIFDEAIQNHAGADFAIFENGFRSPTDSNLAYLELAQVAVSTDGVHYVGFKAISNLDTSIQIAGAGDYTDCRKIHNLAGKYIGSYGTPFDLSDLAIDPWVDIMNIHFIRITDVVGSLDAEYACRDSLFQKINDPYPTPFAAGGFDLDALGLMSSVNPNAVMNLEAQPVSVYPVPFDSYFQIASSDEVSFDIYNSIGQMMMSSHPQTHAKVFTSSWPKGTYFIHIYGRDGHHQVKVIHKL